MTIAIEQVHQQRSPAIASGSILPAQRLRSDLDVPTGIPDFAQRCDVATGCPKNFAICCQPLSALSSSVFAFWLRLVSLDINLFRLCTGQCASDANRGQVPCVGHVQTIPHDLVSANIPD